jgi:hypothetical protein
MPVVLRYNKDNSDFFKNELAHHLKEMFWRPFQSIIDQEWLIHLDMIDDKMSELQKKKAEAVFDTVRGLVKGIRDLVKGKLPAGGFGEDGVSVALDVSDKIIELIHTLHQVRREKKLLEKLTQKLERAYFDSKVISFIDEYLSKKGVTLEAGSARTFRAQILEHISPVVDELKYYVFLQYFFVVQQSDSFSGTHFHRANPLAGRVMRNIPAMLVHLVDEHVYDLVRGNHTQADVTKRGMRVFKRACWVDSKIFWRFVPHNVTKKDVRFDAGAAYETVKTPFHNKAEPWLKHKKYGVKHYDIGKLIAFAPRLIVDSGGSADAYHREWRLQLTNEVYDGGYPQKHARVKLAYPPLVVISRKVIPAPAGRDVYGEERLASISAAYAQIRRRWQMSPELDRQFDRAYAKYLQLKEERKDLFRLGPAAAAAAAAGGGGGGGAAAHARAVPRTAPGNPLVRRIEEKTKLEDGDEAKAAREPVRR